MLKNWIVKTKQIKKKEKGFINHVNYLVDENRASHTFSKITILNDGSKEILSEIDNRREHRQKNSLRGGGVSNYATSFIMSLPTSIKQPSEDEWRQIGLYAVKKIAEAIGVDYLELKKISHIVLHDESSSESKSSHIHVLVGNVMNNEVVKGVSQYRATQAAKNSFNYSVKQLLNEDNKKYMPVNPNKKPLPLHIARLEQTKKMIEELKGSIKSWFSDLTQYKNAYLKASQTAKLFNKIDDSDIKNNIKDDIYESIEEVEKELDIFEEPKYLNQAITPKTNRKRRKRIKKE